ncbi:MAG: glycosyltransferase [Bacteroidia bacterium]|nr:glycosyltransferase [Bacteroidia bacterium]
MFPFQLLFNKLAFQILLKKNVDVVYVYSPNILFLPIYLACVLRRVPLHIEKTELDSIKQQENSKDIVNRFLYKMDEFIAPRLATSLITISNRLTSHYQQISSKPIFQLTAFIPYHALNWKSGNEPEKRDGITLGYLGSFGLKDDLHTLIEAYKRLRGEGLPINLKMVGRAPSHLNQSEDYNEIELTGELPAHQLLAALSDCDLMVAIRKDSDYANYGFPSKLAEYFMTSKPIICSRSSDIPDLLEHKKQVYLIQSEQTDELVEAIRWLFEHRTDATEIGMSGNRWALDHWHPDRVLVDWSEWIFRS